MPNRPGTPPNAVTLRRPDGEIVVVERAPRTGLPVPFWLAVLLGFGAAATGAIVSGRRVSRRQALGLLRR